MSEYVTIYVTIGHSEAAAKLLRTLCEERLIACGNIVPQIISIYWWNERVETSGESAIFMKTRGDLVDAAKARILELHPYEIPCVTVWPIIDGNQAYLDWVGKETRQSGAGTGASPASSGPAGFGKRHFRS